MPLRRTFTIGLLLVGTTIVQTAIVQTAIVQTAIVQTAIAQDTDSAESSSSEGKSTTRKLSFNRDIRPILSDTCFFCHGPDSAHREAGLRLDIEEEAKDYAIVPGEPEDSDIILRIMSDDPDMLMPPPESEKSLTKEQIERLKRWVAEGAEYEPYWAYATPESTDPPQVDPVPHAQSPWPLDPIDHFVLAAQQQEGYQPAEPADPATLIRRVTFDLTGLPPTPEQVREFVADPSERAYRRLVDRLLASPAFGERMASYWLDLVRYADTVGYHGDQDHNISPYRDYVVDAFNQDLSFDQFTREQIAGDLLPDAGTRQLIASGYNRLLQTSHEGGVQTKEYLAIYAADRIRNVSAVWMGATVGCAQCHDHKYDPYKIDDFYSMVAFFADVDEQQHFKVGTNALPTKRPPEIVVLPPWQQQWLEDVQAEIKRLEQRLAADQDSADSKAKLESLKAERDYLESAKRVTMITKSIEPREIRVLPRGNWLDDSGPVVEPSIPEFLGDLQKGDRRANRLDLANWLVDVEAGNGGQTARVMANRYWYLLFGRGISPSLADFGGQGAPPTHPELLDHLAIELIENLSEKGSNPLEASRIVYKDDSLAGEGQTPFRIGSKGGWSTKAMMRRLVLTQTYRMSSEATAAQLAADPENEFLTRQARFRLPAEMVRDNALAISGMLVRQVGGPSIKPPQPVGYYRHLNFPKRVYVPDQNAQQYRRGLYMHWQRQFLHPMLKALDAPSREECTAQRPRSNTPLEALVMLNDPSMVDAAVALAARVLRRDELTDRQRLVRAFELAAARKPDDFELKLLQQLLEEERSHYTRDAEAAETLLSSTGPGIDRTVASEKELAAWSSVARTLLNLYETVARN